MGKLFKKILVRIRYRLLVMIANGDAVALNWDVHGDRIGKETFIFSNDPNSKLALLTPSNGTKLDTEI